MRPIFTRGRALQSDQGGLHQSYAGPHSHTPARQRYHLQVFALDTRVKAAPDLGFEALAAAMRGHVLASGQLVGWAARDPQASPESNSTSGQPPATDHPAAVGI